MKEGRMNNYMILAVISNMIGAMNLNLNKYFARDLGIKTSALLFGIRYIVAGIIMIFMYSCSSSEGSESNFRLIKKQPSILIHLVLIGLIIVTWFRFFNNTALLTVNSDLAAVSEQLQGLFNIAIMAIISRELIKKIDVKSTLAYIVGALVLVVGAGILKTDLIGLSFLLVSVLLLAVGDLYIKYVHQKYGMSIKFIRGATGIVGGLPMLFGKVDVSLIHPKHIFILICSNNIYNNSTSLVVISNGAPTSTSS